MLKTPDATSPADALAQLARHDGPVLVDFDETLYLHNSTEEFVDSACPALLAFVLMRLLQWLAPWRLTGGEATRDVWRVATLRVLMPWSMAVWRRSARRLGREGLNRPLARALAQHAQPVYVVTLGFDAIVAPLLAAMRLGPVRLVAMRIWRFRDRRDGKLARVDAALGAAVREQALCITDSAEDAALLSACRRGLRVVWPEARFREAFDGVYLPGRYITRVKRPKMRYIYRSIISDEYSLWVLASLPLVTQPLTHVLGLALLAVSFWAIYEYGYVDNDLTGLSHERDPQLTPQFFAHPPSRSALLPWVWAAGAGVGALLLLRWPEHPLLTDLLAWAAVLGVTFLWFRLYNRIDKRTRIWLFAGLQSLRSAAPVAVVAITPVGAVALVAHVLARWVPYYTYRAVGNRYAGDHVGINRLLFFVLIGAALAVAVGWEVLWTPTAALLLLWFAFKARSELRREVRTVHFITGPARPGEPPPQPSAGRRRPLTAGR